MEAGNTGLDLQFAVACLFQFIMAHLGEHDDRFAYARS